MPPKKRKSNAPPADDETPSKKKMTRFEKEAMRARAADWAKDRILDKTSPRRSKATSRVSPKSTRKQHQRLGPQIMDNDETTGEDVGVVESASILPSPPPYQQLSSKKTSAKLSAPKANGQVEKDTTVMTDPSHDVIASTEESLLVTDSASEVNKWVSSYWVLLVMVLLILSNVVLGGLVWREKLNHQMTRWQLEQDAIDPPMQQQDELPETSDGQESLREVETLRARVAELEAQKRGLQNEFTELLEELMEERAQND